ncbi:unannotated protein [freshwater metagenome]|uniref:Unannotated protein n=1 Tax=freshwater metagenome TaxID=449393 RepID=A0A6J6WQI8_9ZZZZ
MTDPLQPTYDCSTEWRPMAPENLDGSPMATRLSVVTFLHAGGVTASLRGLLPELQTRGYSITVIGINRDGAVVRLDLAQFLEYRFPAVSPRWDNSLAQMTRRLASIVCPSRLWAKVFSLPLATRKELISSIEDVSQIALFTHPRLAIGVVQGMPAGIVVLGQFHNSFSAGRASGELLEISRGYRNVDAIVMLTSEDAAAMSEFTRGSLPVRWAPNAHSRPALEHLPNPEPGKYVYLGRIVRQKRIDLLIKAWAQAKLEHCQLWIVGSGETRRLSNLAKRLGVDASVNFSEHSEFPEGVLATAQALLMTSRHEGLPMTVVEAAFVGTPTLAINCAPGVAYVVRATNGVIVNSSSSKRFAVALAKLAQGPATNDERLERIAGASANFSPEAVADRWEILFGEARRHRAASLK